MASPSHFPIDYLTPVKYHWNRGIGYECSSKGDKRFSAFYALLNDGNSIEWHYQVRIKGYSSIKEGKGKPPLKPMADGELWWRYKSLWSAWATNNKELIDELAVLAANAGYVLSDVFATTPINQARALAEILNDYNGYVLNYARVYRRDFDYDAREGSPFYTITRVNQTGGATRPVYPLDLVTTTEFMGKPIVAKCFTSNGIVRKDGRLSMGRGSALAVRDNYENVDLALGNYIKLYGNEVAVVSNALNKVLGIHETIVSFPTKNHFRDASDIDLIIESCIELSKVAHVFRTKTGEGGYVLLPCPGATNGWLPWETTREIIEDLLPSNVILIGKGDH